MHIEHAEGVRCNCKPDFHVKEELDEPEGWDE